MTTLRLLLLGVLLALAGRICTAEDVDCVLSDWSYSDCSHTCGGGLRTATRTIVTQPQGSGAACGELQLTNLLCGDHPCPSTPQLPADRAEFVATVGGVDVRLPAGGALRIVADNESPINVASAIRDNAQKIADLESGSITAEEFEERLLEVKNEADVAKANITSLASKVMTAQSDIATASSGLSSLQTTVAGKASQSDLDSVEDELRGLHLELAQNVSDTHAVHDGSIAGLHLELAGLDERIEVAEDDIDILQINVTTLAAQGSGRDTEISNLKTRVGQLEADNIQLKATVESLVETVQILNETVAVALAGVSSIFGDGSDGPWAPTASATMPCYYVSQNIALGQSTLKLSSCSGLHVGREVFIHQTQHASGGASAGVYMFAKITSISGSCDIVLDRSATKAFVTGTTSGGAPYVTQVVPVMHHSDVTIASGVTISATPWNGQCGGILVIKAIGKITVHGSISASSTGFRGSPQYVSPSDYVHGYIGESESSSHAATRRAAASGSGGGAGNGQGGGYGGAHETVGTVPQRGGCDSAAAGAPTTIGDEKFERIYFGGSGGSSGSHCCSNGRNGATGGRSGGIVILASGGPMTITGTVQSNGGDGQHGYRASSSVGQPMGGGGGGAGGSVWLVSDQVTGSNQVSVVGGNGGNAGSYNDCNPGGYGGSGGRGRIRLSPTFTD